MSKAQETSSYLLIVIIQSTLNADRHDTADVKCLSFVVLFLCGS